LGGAAQNRSKKEREFTGSLKEGERKRLSLQEHDPLKEKLGETVVVNKSAIKQSRSGVPQGEKRDKRKKKSKAKKMVGELVAQKTLRGDRRMVFT